MFQKNGTHIVNFERLDEIFILYFSQTQRNATTGRRYRTINVFALVLTMVKFVARGDLETNARMRFARVLTNTISTTGERMTNLV